MGKTTKEKPTMEAVKEWAKRNNKLEPWCIGVYNYHVDNHYQSIMEVQKELNRPN